ncbi:MAG: heme exporter protein CcmD [Venatoribacter sp.]
MQFHSFAEFIAMGNHGFYVWLAYGLTALIIVWNVVQPKLQRKRLLKEQAQRLRREKKHAPKA